jgi:hypothetical protein
MTKVVGWKTLFILATSINQSNAPPRPSKQHDSDDDYIHHSPLCPCLPVGWNLERANYNRWSWDILALSNITPWGESVSLCPSK